MTRRFLTPMRVAFFATAAMLLAVGAGIAALPTPSVGALIVDVGLGEIHVGSNAALLAFKPSFLQSLASVATPTTVHRDSFYGDNAGGGASYTYSSTPCVAPDNGLQVSAAAGGCWLVEPSVPREPRLWGAKGDGVTDDTVPLQAWLTNISDFTSVSVSRGTYLFKTFLSRPVALHHVQIRGAGAVLMYGGAVNTGNIITLGQPVSQCSDDVVIEDLPLRSSTVMTSGWGWQLNEMCNTRLRNMTMGGDFGNDNTLWSGIHLNGFNTVQLFQGSYQAQQDAITANSDTTTNAGTDLYIDGGARIVNSRVGVHIAGNVGGSVFGDSDIVGNNIDVLVDQSQIATGNGAIFFGPTTFLDQTSPYPASYTPPPGAPIAKRNLQILDTGTNGVVYMTGTWVAGGGDACVYVGSGVSMEVHWTGGALYNCDGTGVVQQGTGQITMTSVKINGMTHAIDNSAGTGTVTTCDLHIGPNFGGALTLGTVTPSCVAGSPSGNVSANNFVPTGGLGTNPSQGLIGGYYTGVGIQGSTEAQGKPIFGVLGATDGSSGLGNTDLTVYDTGKMVGRRNTLDDGSGNAMMTGNLSANNIVPSGGLGTGPTSALLGQYYTGLAVQGSTEAQGKPIFGVLGSTDSNNGIGNTDLTVYDTGKVVSRRNTLDDGTGNAAVMGHMLTGSTAPTLSSCGTSPSIVGSDRAGIIVTGTGATACTVTFATAYVSEPICNVNGESAAVTYSKTKSAITITAGAGAKIDYSCIAQAGG